HLGLQRDQGQKRLLDALQLRVDRAVPGPSQKEEADEADARRQKHTEPNALLEHDALPDAAPVVILAHPARPRRTDQSIERARQTERVMRRTQPPLYLSHTPVSLSNSTRSPANSESSTSIAVGSM